MVDGLAQFSLAWFKGALDTALTVTPNAEGLDPQDVRVMEVNAGPQSGGFEQLSVILLGPPSPVIPQGTHHFAHASLGEFDLFMTPVGRKSAGIEYEICISHPAASER